MGGRKKTSTRSSSSSGSESGDSDDENGEPNQWVVAIVASTTTDDGKAFYLVRWGADDNGKAYEKGQEEDTWEPAEHVVHLEAYSAFLANSRKPLPTEALALNVAMRLQVAQLTTPGQSRSGEAGAHASLPTDAATNFLCSELEVDLVTDSIKELGDKTELLPGETIPSSARSPAVLSPSDPQHDPYDEGSPDAMHPEVADQRGRLQLRAGVLDFAGADLKLDEASGVCATPGTSRAPHIRPPAFTRAPLRLAHSCRSRSAGCGPTRSGPMTPRRLTPRSSSPRSTRRTRRTKNTSSSTTPTTRSKRAATTRRRMWSTWASRQRRAT